MCKELNIFVHPLFPNVIVVNEYNMIKTKIFTELNLRTKDMRKGNGKLTKENE